jgi:hypothetical protein
VTSSSSLQRRGGNDIAALEQQVADIAERLRMVPSAFTSSPDPIDLIWVVQGGNSLVSPPVTGIKYVGANVDLSTLPIPTIIPAPVSGDVVIVDAANPPSGLPDGVGTGRALGGTTYAFLLNDTRRFTPYEARALRKGSVVYASDGITYDRSSGGVTYRYVLLFPEARN